MKQRFSIPKPCSENWDAMTPTDKGAFCQKCALEVHDLSNFSLTEIRSKLNNHQGNLCVSIDNYQLDALNDDVLLWYKPDETFKHRLFLFALFMVFGMTVFNGSAQSVNLYNELQTTHQQAGEVSNSSAKSILKSFEEKEGSGGGGVKSKGMMIIDSWEDHDEEPKHLKNRKTLPKTTIKKTASDSIETITPIDPNANLIFNVKAYPNPTKTSTTLQIDVPTKTEFAIKVFSITGNQVRSYGTVEFPSGSNTFEVNLDTLARGTYIIGLQSADFGKAIQIKKL